MENATINQNWKALIKPGKLQIENNKDKSITTVVAEPLEKGYALTIGNSLRRILLSSIQGSAITLATVLSSLLVISNLFGFIKAFQFLSITFVVVCILYSPSFWWSCTVMWHRRSVLN